MLNYQLEGKGLKWRTFFGQGTTLGEGALPMLFSVLRRVREQIRVSIPGVFTSVNLAPGADCITTPGEQKQGSCT